MRQERGLDLSEPLAQGYAVTHPSGVVVPPQPRGWDQLLLAASGAMTVETTEGTWVVPPHRALWVPDGVQHRISLSGRVRLRNLYLQHGAVTMPPGCQVLNVTPLLRELVFHAVGLAPLHRGVAEHERLIGVLGDVLATVAMAPVQLPAPVDPTARALADLIRSDPASTTSLAALARQVGASTRSLERRFKAETGLTPVQWRQRFRLLEAMRRLADGEQVTSTAAAVGYSTPSAFTAMFRQQTGHPPSRYFRSR